MATRQWHTTEHNTLRRLSIDGMSLKSRYPALQVRRGRDEKHTITPSHKRR